MDDRFNTAAGWVLFAGIVALGLSSISAKLFHTERPEEPGYPVEVAAGPVGGGEMTMAEALNMETTTASAGEKIFAKCGACHTIEAGGADGIGPNLHGILGKPIGKHAAGFAYSSDLSGHGGVWNWDTINEWLKSPRAFAAGTKMSFAGLSKIEDRAAVALYLNENGSNLPVPEYVAAVAEDAEAADDGATGEDDAAAEEGAATEGDATSEEGQEASE